MRVIELSKRATKLKDAVGVTPTETVFIDDYHGTTDAIMFR
jgi:hypothetical protein